MKPDRKQLKREARDAMRQARPAPFWVTLVLVGIMLVLGVLTRSLDGTLDAVRTMYAAAREGVLVYVEPVPTGGFVGGLLSMALQVMTMVMGVGFTLYALRVWRRERAGCGDLFDGFGVFLRAIWIHLLLTLLMMMWSLVYMLPVTSLIVTTGQTWPLLAGLPLLAPGVVASYAYRLAVYLMLDNPGASCWHCIRLSRQIMRGHKWQAFVLDLSFLGWLLLCVALPVVGLILLVWVEAYMQVTNAGFYCKLAEDFAGRIAADAPPV